MTPGIGALGISGVRFSPSPDGELSGELTLTLVVPSVYGWGAKR